jgi:hypothetical protein
MVSQAHTAIVRGKPGIANSFGGSKPPFSD